MIKVMYKLPTYLTTGVSHAFAEIEALSFVSPHRLPFLPTPMGKGVISDQHPLCVSAARSR